MAWYDRLFGIQREEKLNPAQSFIAMEEGFTLDTREIKDNYRSAYEELEVVNRAVNMIVDDVADIPVDVGGKIAGMTPVYKNVRRATVNRLLNIEPNPFQDVNSFKRNLIIDLLIDGNIFIYYDGGNSSLYHLPAENVEIETDEKTYIKKINCNNIKLFSEILTLPFAKFLCLFICIVTDCFYLRKRQGA